MKSSAKACAIPERCIYPSVLMTALTVSAVLPLTSFGIKTHSLEMAAGVIRMTAPITNAVLVRSPVLYMCAFGAANGHSVFATHTPASAKRNDKRTDQPKKQTHKENPTPLTPQI